MELQTTEIWKAIPSWEEFYEVSSVGRVRSLRNTRANSRQASFILKPTQLSSGYLQVDLRKLGAKKKESVHRLVLFAFVGLPPDGTQCRHLNDVKTDNRLENLCWGTAKENKADSYRNKRSPVGSVCYQAKLNEAKVKTILERLKDGYLAAGLARRFGISRRTVRRIRDGSVWKHVERA